jgi:hypothetical protein
MRDAQACQPRLAPLMQQPQQLIQYWRRRLRRWAASWRQKVQRAASIMNSSLLFS